MDNTGTIAGSTHRTLGMLRAPPALNAASAERQPGITLSLSTLSQMLEFATSIDERFSQTTDRLVGGVPRDASVKNQETGERHGGAIGELESMLGQLASKLSDINYNVVRMERLV